jgi:hypothetical protein
LAFGLATAPSLPGDSLVFISLLLSSREAAFVSLVIHFASVISICFVFHLPSLIVVPPFYYG